jgi:hypothetical protein
VRQMTRLAEWFTAHENCLGFWLGTTLSFLATYPSECPMHSCSHSIPPCVPDLPTALTL